MFAADFQQVRDWPIEAELPIMGLRMPAEWEPQAGVMMAWPHAATDWAPILAEAQRCWVEIAEAIVASEYLICIAPDTAEPRAALSHLPQERIIYVALPTNDTWARDFGPICLTSEGANIVADFRFNGWGEKFAAELDNAVTARMAQLGIFNATRRDDLRFVLEGGSIESDGKGTIMTTSQCLLAPHRNQPMTQAEIELALIDGLGAQRVLWLNHGAIAGDDTDGHIDTLARFADEQTILYAYDEGNEELRQMERQLQALRTPKGNPYRLIALPQPSPLTDEDGQPMPATYANFLIINGRVLVPTYGQPDADAEACRRIAETMPDREIVGIDCRPLIWQHGSLHCMTMQLPRGFINSDKLSH